MIDSIADQRQRLSCIIDEFVNTARTLVHDTSKISRKVVHASDKVICELAFGDHNEKTRVEPNDFNATIVVFEGAAEIDFGNGEKKTINEGKRDLFVPKHTGFTVTSISHGSAILTILDKL